MPGQIPRAELEKLLDLLGDIPPMPSVAIKVLKVASSEFAQVSDLTRLISVDQGLASKVLSTCNSAYYGLPQRVKTLNRAVALLGFKSVRNLVLVHSLPWKRGGTPRFADQMIFEHAAAVAVASRGIAAHTGRVDPEEALLGGLMHDAGRLALNLLKPEEYEPVARQIYDQEGESVALEQSALGVDHTAAGELVLRRWSFPEELVRVARDHHDPPEGLADLTLVVRAADEAAHLFGKGVKAPDEPPDAVPPALAVLGWERGDLESLHERIDQMIEQSQDIFGAV